MGGKKRIEERSENSLIECSLFLFVFFSFSEGIAIDDVQFHRCVRLGRFDADRTISFIPPDGEFQLCSYRITQNIDLPFTVFPAIIERGRTRIEYEIKVKANFSFKLYATSVDVRIPTPRNTAKYKIQVASGTVNYVPSNHWLEWK